MDQCYQHLSECHEYPTDALIKPLVQISALMCRVNNYFSYDDIDNAEVQGETMIQLSITNFQSELARLTETIPSTLLDSNRTHNSLDLVKEQDRANASRYLETCYFTS